MVLYLQFHFVDRSEKKNVKIISYVSKSIHDELFNAPGFDRLKLCYTGLRMFGRNGKKFGDGETEACSYRLCQEVRA